MIRSPSTAADFGRFLQTPEFPELEAGPRAGVMALRDLGTELDSWLRASSASPEAALRLRALAYLYHDHHDPAHDIVQDLTDVDGALIHAILHRREPDYWNAKYWFRRTHEHTVYLALGAQVPGMATRSEESDLARQLTLPGTFDPFAFVDLCEAVAGRGHDDEQVAWLRRVQQAEFVAVSKHLLAA